MTNDKDNFWTDELVLEFARFTNTESPTFQGRHADIQQFKESKKNKEQPDNIYTIKVGDLFKGEKVTKTYLQDNKLVFETKNSQPPISTPVVDNNDFTLDVKHHLGFQATETSVKTEKDKDYEILTLKGGYMNEDDILIEFGFDKKYYAKGLPIPIELDYLLNVCKSKIQSVRRLSDGIILSIDTITNQGRITGFHIEAGIMVAEFEGNTRHCHINLLTNVNEQTKPQEDKVLFTTEDGVKIYEGDKYYWVDSDLYLGEAAPHINTSNLKTFSTKEKAEEYIKWNKLTLTLMDVMGFTYPTNFDEDIFRKKLLNIIEQKLHN